LDQEKSGNPGRMMYNFGWQIWRSVQISLPHVVRRVAGWFVFKPKIQIWANFGGSCNGIFYGHLFHFTVYCYILRTFGTVRYKLVYFFPFWYSVPRKIWQPWSYDIRRRQNRISCKWAFLTGIGRFVDCLATGLTSPLTRRSRKEEEETAWPWKILLWDLVKAKICK
jgi:hypothetical protein